MTTSPRNSSQQVKKSSNTLQAEALLDRHCQVWIPYDKDHMKLPDEEFIPLSHIKITHNANLSPFLLDYSTIRQLLIINGMGVALGDSVIGISVLTWLLERYPALQITLWRSQTAPTYVEDIYKNISPRLSTVVLPQSLSRTTSFDAVIDLSDFMFRQAFNNMAMIDFFITSLGIPLSEFPPTEKANRWISRYHDKQNSSDPYILFCPNSSANLRAIPENHHYQFIDHIWNTYHTQVKGFSSVTHPAFEDLTSKSSNTATFINHIANAAHVITVDSAAVHIAAGFDIPTTAFFTSIHSCLRVRDYPNCQAIDLDSAEILTGLHSTTSSELLRYAASLWDKACLFLYPDKRSLATLSRQGYCADLTPKPTSRR